MAADSTTQRWWKETDPCQQPLPDAAEKTNMEQYGTSVSPAIKLSFIQNSRLLNVLLPIIN